MGEEILERERDAFPRLAIIAVASPSNPIYRKPMTTNIPPVVYTALLEPDFDECTYGQCGNLSISSDEIVPAITAPSRPKRLLHVCRHTGFSKSSRLPGHEEENGNDQA